MLHPGGRVRPLRHLDRPVHDRGRGQARHLELRRSQKPISGFNPNTGLKLVRNPNYDPATDDPAVAPGQPRPVRDRGQHQPRQHLRQDRARRARGLVRDPANAVLRKYLQDRTSASTCASTAGDRIWFVYMNLTHAAVRRRPRAQGDELVMDLEGIQRAWGGPCTGTTPTHILPTRMLAAARDYTPVPAAAVRGRRRGRQGRDEAVEVRHQQGRHLRRPGVQGRPAHQPQLRPLVDQSPIIAQSAAKIGIKLDTREASRSAVHAATGQPSRKMPMSSRQRLGQGLRRPVHLHGAVRQPEHPARGQHGVGARGPHAREGQEGRGRLSRPAARRTWTPTSTPARR